jgi:PAS domain S-box-containing protein
MPNSSMVPSPVQGSGNRSTGREESNSGSVFCVDMGNNDHSNAAPTLGIHQTISSPVLAHTGRPDGYLDFFSPTWLDFVGQPLDKLLGWKWTSYIHPEDIEAFVQKWRESIESGRPVEETARIRRADGEYRWMLLHHLPLRDCDGYVVKWNGSIIEIQHRSQVEERLGASTQDRQIGAFHFAAAQRLVHIGGWVFDPQKGFDYWSHELFRIHGLDPTVEAPSTAQYLALVHPQDRESMAALLTRMPRDVSGFDITKRIVRPNGEVRYVRCVSSPLVVDNRTAKRIGIGIDVTEHELLSQELHHREIRLQRNEAELRRSEQELREVIDAIPTIAWSALPDGSNTYVNKGFVEYSGLSAEQAAGSGWQAAAHPDDLHQYLSKWMTSLASGDPFEHEVRFRRADGQYRWHLCRGVPRRDAEGRIVKWYGILFDIDELKRAQSALQEQEHELLGIIETIPSMLWSVSPTGQTTYLSQRVLEYCGAPSDELINRGWERFIHPDDREETTKAFDRAMRSGESYSAIHRLRRADGEYRWHHSMGEPLRDPHGKIIQWYGLATDIDERKRAEDHLRDARIELNRAARIASLAELSASIAHELNQPLMSVLANAQAAKRWLAATAPNLKETATSIDRIIRDARAADEVMQHIRALFKQEPYDKAEITVLEVVKSAIRFVHEDPKKREVRIDWHLDEDLPSLFVDFIQIQQVFVNLISNAIDAMEGRPGLLHIQIRAARMQTHEILIQVVDNGPGVEDPKRIFDAFVTTKKTGMGMGLAISRSIVEAHCGRLWAENNPSSGATFNVVLPLHSE